MAGILHKIEEKFGGGSAAQHKEEENKHHKEEAEKQHKKEGEKHEGGFVDKIKAKIPGAGGEHGEKDKIHGDGGEKKKKGDKKKKKGEEKHGGHSSSSSDSD